jgi:Ras-related GTP-binding protein C/D
MTVETLGVSFSQFATMIFVIDIRVYLFASSRFMPDAKPVMEDLYQHAIARLVDFVIAAYRENPQINFEVFVHKSERLADDDKIGMLVVPTSYFLRTTLWVQKVFVKSKNVSVTD